jgi:hypothetical protein
VAVHDKAHDHHGLPSNPRLLCAAPAPTLTHADPACFLYPSLASFGRNSHRPPRGVFVTSGPYIGPFRKRRPAGQEWRGRKYLILGGGPSWTQFERDPAVARSNRTAQADHVSERVLGRVPGRRDSDGPCCLTASGLRRSASRPAFASRDEDLGRQPPDLEGRSNFVPNRHRNGACIRTVERSAGHGGWRASTDATRIPGVAIPLTGRSAVGYLLAPASLSKLNIGQASTRG